MKEDITTIKVAIGKIEEHLKAMNGSIARHESKINDCEKEINKIDKQQLKNTAIISIITGCVIGLITIFLPIIIDKLL